MLLTSMAPELYNRDCRAYAVRPMAAAMPAELPTVRIGALSALQGVAIQQGQEPRCASQRPARTGPFATFRHNQSFRLPLKLILIYLSGGWRFDAWRELSKSPMICKRRSRSLPTGDNRGRGRARRGMTSL